MSKETYHNKNGKEISMEEFFKGRKPSPPPQGKQKIMEKYTKLVMKRLYGEDVHVFFTDDSNLSISGVQIKAMFRDKNVGPPKMGDEMIWAKDPKCSITFKGALYGEDDLSGHAWDTIVHEVSHYEGGMESKFDNEGYLITHHTNEFKNIIKRNQSNVDDLRKKFNKEVGWDEDYVYGGAKTEYYYIEMLAEVKTEDAPEDGGCDTVMERIQYVIEDIVEKSIILNIRPAKKEEIEEWL